MNKTLRTLALSATFAMTSTAALATGNHTPQPQPQPQPQPTVINNAPQSEAAARAAAAAAAAANANANANANVRNTNNVGVHNNVGVGVHNNVGPVTAMTGPVTVGPSTSSANVGNVSGGNVGDVSATGGQGGQGGAGGQGGNVGNITNEFRSFVGTNAPGLVGAVDNCLAVVGSSFALNVFGNTGVGVGGGSQKTEFSEQCAAVSQSMRLFAEARGDKQLQLFALNMLIEALPNYGPKAKAATLDQLNKYEPEDEPDSLTEFWGAKRLTRKPAVPAQQPVIVQPMATNTFVYEREFITEREVKVPGPARIIVKKVNPDGTPYVEPCKPCTNAGTAAPAPAQPASAPKPTK